ncbi:MAG: Bug family tripartite tricarboxylate transporter substrate binding protein [Pigmentiphaga sp.]
MYKKIWFIPALLLALSSQAANAEDLQKYPSGPVTVVVPFAAGGPTEPLLRPFVEKLSKKWSQPVIVDNRPGANGIIGTRQVVKEPGDGRTILYHITGMIQNALLYRSAEYDPFKDFKPVLLFGTQPLVLAVSTESPYQTIESLLGATQAQKEALAYGSVGAGSTFHIYGELLASNLGVKAPHIAYKGMAPVMNDLIPGRLPISFVPAPMAIQFSESGKLRPLAVTGVERLQDLPDVPTLSEAGLAGFELLGFYGLFVPSATPDDLVEKIAADAREIASEPEMVQRMNEIYIKPTRLNPGEIQSWLKKENEQWGGLIKQFQIKLD